MNAHISIIIITLKLQSSNKYDRSVTNDHAWTWMQKMCNYMWFYNKHSAFINKHVKINHIEDFLINKTLKLWMTKQHHSDMLNNSIWHDHPDQIDTVNQLFNMIIKTCDELNQQEWIKCDYYSLMQISSVCDFSADLLFLTYHINLSSLQDTVYNHFK